MQPQRENPTRFSGGSVNYKVMPKDCPVCGLTMIIKGDQSEWKCNNPACKLDYIKFTETKQLS